MTDTYKINQSSTQGVTNGRMDNHGTVYGEHGDQPEIHLDTNLSQDTLRMFVSVTQHSACGKINPDIDRQPCAGSFLRGARKPKSPQDNGMGRPSGLFEGPRAGQRREGQRDMPMVS